MDNKELYAHPEQWIENCEASFFQQLNRIAEKIREQENIKFIRLTGPTCSGKTTTSHLLIERLKESGKNVHLISIDDFYYDKEVLHRRAKEEGRYTPDYDSVHTIDLEELSRFVEACVGIGGECQCPIFDFTKGKRTGYRTISCKSQDCFIMEGIQVLYPEVSALLEQYPSIGIYIAPESTIFIGGQEFLPNEIRLLRRLVRDYNFRGTMPEQTFAMWDGVRENEEKNIFPYVGHCSLHIDSTMPYEIGILKPYLNRILPTVPKDSTHKGQAEEIFKQLVEVVSISDQYIRPDSLYKEFI